MSRTLITPPQDASSPDWDTLPEEDGMIVFKVQVEPYKVANIRLKTTVFQAGKYSFFVRKAKRIPGAPPDAPIQPYKIWCDEITNYFS